MANYISLAEAKTYLWITDTSQDSKLTLIIDWVQNIVVNYIWFDIASSSKTENISICDIWCYWKIFLNAKPITSLNKINWVSYTWVLWTNYMIDNNKIIINDISLYLTNLNFSYFTIEYTAWFTIIPNDVKLVMLTLTAQEFNKKDWSIVKSYTLWPRTIDFDNSVWQAEWVINSIKATLTKYKPFTLNRI